MRKLPAFQLDLRSLGIFRIGLGVVTMLDLFERWPWLATFYSPSGVFPTARGIVSRFPSVFALSESDAMAHVVWSVALIAAILFTIGVRTRVSPRMARRDRHYISYGARCSAVARFVSGDVRCRVARADKNLILEQSRFARYRNSLSRRMPAMPRFVTIAMNRIHASTLPLHSLPKWNEWLIAIALLSVVAGATLPAPVFGISQFCGMYSDDTHGVASWVAPSATLGDGSQVDAWSGRPVDRSFNGWAARPWQVRSELDAISAVSSVDLRRSFVRWACRRNGAVNVQIVHLDQRMVAPREAEPRVTTIDSLPCQ